MFSFLSLTVRTGKWSLAKGRSNAFGYRNSAPWPYRWALSMNVKTILSPVGGKPISLQKERVFYCSLNHKLCNMVFPHVIQSMTTCIISCITARPCHSMQWIQEYSLHSSTYYSSDSSINCCFHSIPVKWKSTRDKWGMRAEPGLFGQPFQGNKTLVLQSTWTISNTNKHYEVWLPDASLTALMARFQNLKANNQKSINGSEGEAVENPFSKATMACLL